jgi:hypothetical protein
MTPTATRPLPSLDRLRPRRLLVAVLAVAAVAAVAIAVAPWFRTESPVARLTIDNPTVYQVNVEVSGSDGGWLDLGAVERQGSKTVEEVTDQGSRWLFRFSYGGVGGGEVALARSDLAAGGWHVTIPATVGQRLHDAGLAPSAA